MIQIERVNGSGESNGLLSPDLSSKGGEGEDVARSLMQCCPLWGSNLLRASQAVLTVFVC